jgi:hypothetical protein
MSSGTTSRCSFFRAHVHLPLCWQQQVPASAIGQAASHDSSIGAHHACLHPSHGDSRLLNGPFDGTRNAHAGLSICADLDSAGTVRLDAPSCSHEPRGDLRKRPVSNVLLKYFCLQPMHT